MKFRRKLFLYKCIENLPFGMDIYHFAQEKVTKSLLLPDEDFMSRFDDKVLRHEIAIKRYGMTEQKKSVFFEFGAGWDMLAPIGFSLVGGVKRYIAVDLNKHLRKSIIQNTMELYRSNIDKIERVTGNSVRLDKNINCYPDIRQNAGSWLKDNLAIEYLAPCDAGDTNIKSESVDYVVSNVSLEHIPKKNIERILKECMRLLRKGGLISVTVDYSDHWSHSDPSITEYNFLRYSEDEWHRYNPSLHYQNRLRHSDYYKMLQNAGFQIIKEEFLQPDDKAYKKIKTITVSEELKKYSIEDLLITRGWFVAKKG